jgi:hypothetical protein
MHHEGVRNDFGDRAAALPRVQNGTRHAHRRHAQWTSGQEDLMDDNYPLDDETLDDARHDEAGMFGVLVLTKPFSFDRLTNPF